MNDEIETKVWLTVHGPEAGVGYSGFIRSSPGSQASRWNSEPDRWRWPWSQ